MTKTPKPLIPWQSVPLTDGTHDLDPTSELGLQRLDEYRRKGSIRGYWPCTAAQLATYAADDPAVAEAGVAVEAIDWTGFPTAREVFMRNAATLLREQGTLRAPAEITEKV